MLNFRKIKKDFSTNIINEGKDLYEKKMVLSAKIVKLTTNFVRVSCQVLGNFNHTYECEIEIDRLDSSISDSNCDCTYKYDCQHLASVVFYLEKFLDELVVNYSKETDIETSKGIDAEEKETLRRTFLEAENKEVERKGKIMQKELLQEYIHASDVLGQSPFFLKEEHSPESKAELLVVFCISEDTAPERPHLQEIQLALRLPSRSKPLNVPNAKEFLDSIRYHDRQLIGNKRYHFALSSFDAPGQLLLKQLLNYARFPEIKGERNLRSIQIDSETFGNILAVIHDYATEQQLNRVQLGEEKMDCHPMPGLYWGSFEEPLCFSNVPSILRVGLEYLEVPAPKILLNPMLVVQEKAISVLDETKLFECAKPGMIFENFYFRFEPRIKRRHLRNFFALRDVTIPEPLFGTFVENSLPQLMRFAQVVNQEIVEKFVTLPFTGDLKAECLINYLDGELEASLSFIYGKIKVPFSSSNLTNSNIETFVTSDGILARNLTEERKIVEELFQDFVFENSQGTFTTKSERKIVEFMTEIIPHHQAHVEFHCPQNLLEQFLYDDTHFTLKLKETERIDLYEVDLKVNGFLNGITVDLLWECISAKKNFIELSKVKPADKKTKAKTNKILVLDLEKLAPIVQIFDEMGINQLNDHKEQRPLWSLVNIHAEMFKGLAIEFSMSPRLKKIQKQMLSDEPVEPKEIPSEIQATLRQYQKEGIGWLERLRNMHLNGVLADDMGLGKTLQSIVSITQHKKDSPDSLSIVICPTSLVHNWKEEFNKFNHHLRVLVVDGTPVNRKKVLAEAAQYDVLITSYSLLQKDIEVYQKINFAYGILDEAHHIKNRTTRNAKSVKLLKCAHRLVLTGTPIENSLEELWSLFDFLMPGLLSTFDRFVEKYVRNLSKDRGSEMEMLRRKLSPFILRRMKKDVIAELPPVSKIVYHCHLSDTQRELYTSYAKTAREELSDLVRKEGFDKVQIHVLATLTRLKQICCHPAIFAKEKAEEGDSAKYDMLMELLQTLIEGKHKTVIFSQYTKMLQIMKHDLQRNGIRFEYLDGSTKNRLEIVKKFNQDENIPIFLVSLKAGGTGLNLVGADTVIHYDMWWNPAVENQATDRVHRLGQQKKVTEIKFMTINSIEQAIVKVKESKEELVKEVINTDEEAISKLTWDDVLELLQTP